MTYAEGPRMLDDVLSGAAGAQGVRQVVEDPLRYGAEELFGAAGLTRHSGRVELRRSKFKPGRKLSADYVLYDGSGPARPRHAAVAWTTQADGVRTTLSVFPVDDAMPQLQRLADPSHLAALVASLTGRSADRAAPPRLDTVRYRPGQRHVLLARPAEVGAVYVKTDRDCSGQDAVRVAEVITESLDQHYPAAGTAQPLGWVAEDQAALWWQAPGTSLSELVTRRTAGASSALWRVGRALRVLHGAPRARVGRTTPWPLRDPRTEARSALSAAAHIRTLLPDVGAAFTVLLSDAVGSLEQLPAEPPVLAHGDFKCDNILLHQGAPRILDLDRTCGADPSLDLGKLLADLAWWCPDGTDRFALADAFRAGYGPCDPMRWARAEAWALLFRLKNTARRCALHDPQWEAQVRDRVSSAARPTPVSGGTA